MQASLNCVALANEILAKDVGDVDVLMARVEAIEAAVCILLQHREVSGVVLNAIVVGSAEEANAEVVIRKNEDTKIRDKWLDALPDGHKIVVCVHIPSLHFANSLFK